MTQTKSEYQIRIEKVAQLRKLGINPYANKYDKQHMISNLVAKEGDSFRDIEEIILNPKNEYKTA